MWCLVCGERGWQVLFPPPVTQTHTRTHLLTFVPVAGATDVAVTTPAPPPAPPAVVAVPAAAPPAAAAAAAAAEAGGAAAATAAAGAPPAFFCASSARSCSSFWKASAMVIPGFSRMTISRVMAGTSALAFLAASFFSRCFLLGVSCGIERFFSFFAIKKGEGKSEPPHLRERDCQVNSFVGACYVGGSVWCWVGCGASDLLLGGGGSVLAGVEGVRGEQRLEK